MPDQSGQHMMERLATDAPALYEAANRPDLSLQTRKNINRFLAAAFASSYRYAAVLQHQKEAARALSLFEASDYLTEILIRHPEEIATLAETEESVPRLGHGYLFERSLIERSSQESESPVRPSDPVFAYLADSPAPYGEKLALLRQHFRHRAFAVGARDVLELRDVYRSFGDIHNRSSIAQRFMAERHS